MPLPLLESCWDRQLHGISSLPSKNFQPAARGEKAKGQYALCACLDELYRGSLPLPLPVSLSLSLSVVRVFKGEKDQCLLANDLG